jgi:hypothetical protein
MPDSVGYLLASVVIRFDDDYCNVMIISMSTKKIHECSGNHQWSQYDISTTITKGIKKMTKIDANFF